MKKIFAFPRRVASKIKRELLNFIYSYPKVISCNMDRLGDEEYGAWTICPDNINDGSTVYSFGVGTNISFDLELIKKYGVLLFAFDPTPKSIEFLKRQNLPKKFSYYEYGLSNRDEKALFFLPKNSEYVSCTTFENVQDFSNSSVEVPLKRLGTIASELNHKKIDILKMDIEGMEYRVIDDIINSDIEIGQILIEFHHRFNGLSFKMTKNVIKKLKKAGYMLFYVSPNREELSFIKR